MDNQQAVAWELGWLAAMIDGEGWLGLTVSKDNRGVYRNRETIRFELRIVNTDKPIVDKASVIMRKLGVNPYERTREQKWNKVSSRPLHECAIKNMTNIKKVIIPILEYLTGNKRMRADVMLRLIDLRETNPGISNPAYGKGRHGQRTIKPYTNKELELIQICRDLQACGASETTREKRESAIQRLIAHNLPVKI